MIPHRFVALANSNQSAKHQEITHDSNKNLILNKNATMNSENNSGLMENSRIYVKYL